LCSECSTLEVHLLHQRGRKQFKKMKQKETGENLGSTDNLAERQKLIEKVSRENAKRYMSATLISQIISSPLRIEILEKWEKGAFLGHDRAHDKLSRGRFDVCIDYDEFYMCYCDIGSGTITDESYQLFLLLVKEKGEVIINRDPQNLTCRQWTGWTEFC
jgi:hypothetical protein